MKILSGFKFTFIVLILLPSLVVISHFLVTSVIIQYFKSISTPSNVQQNLQYAKLAVDIFSIFEVIVFVVMIIVYPPYPAPYSAEKYFMERGYEVCSIRVQLCKKNSICRSPTTNIFYNNNILTTVPRKLFPC